MIKKDTPIGLELVSFFQIKRFKIIKEQDGDEFVERHIHNEYLAKTTDDFKEVFDREFSLEVKKESLDKLDEGACDLFRRELIDIVQVYLDRYREFTRFFPDHRRKVKLRTAELFIEWLKTEQPLKGLDKKPSIPEKANEINFTNILSRIKFDKDESTRARVKSDLIRLDQTEYFQTSKGYVFATVALIFYQTGWVINTPTFKEWLLIFSLAFNRSKSSYKRNDVEQYIEEMKRKIPFLDKLPKK